MKTCLFLASLGFCFSVAFAQEAAGPADSAAPMKEISPGVFQVGKLRLDKNKKSVAFPGKLNMAKDLIEYVLVTPTGSTHEALLSSEVQPSDLHFAMLLLGAKGAGMTADKPGQVPPGQLDAEYLARAPKLKGENVNFSVKWKDKGGKEQTTPVEDWIVNPETKKVAPRGPWIYNGSMFGSDGGFIAQQQGMFACVVTNPGALINNPRKGNTDDHVWAVNEKVVPPVETPVEIVITMLDGTSETK